MSRSRRALLRKLLDQRRQRRVTWIGLKLPLPEWTYDTPLLATLAPGEVRKITSESWVGTPSWIGRSEDGTQFYQTLGAVVHGRRAVTDEEVVAHVREVLAQKVVEAAQRPKYSKGAPKALGNEGRTLAARDTIRRGRPAVVPTRLAKCKSCGFRAEVPANDDAPATCPRCARGDL